MGRHERFRSELAAGFEALKKETNLNDRAFECLDRRQDETSASWSTATAMGSCIGRSRDAGKRPQLPVRRKKPSPASLLRKRQESPRVVPWHSSQRPKTRHQPVPRGAASGDQGTRGRCPQLPLRRSSRHSTSFPSFEDGRQQRTADLDVAPSYSRGRNETSRTGPNAQPDFACSTSDETRKMSEPSDFMVRWTSSVD